MLSCVRLFATPWTVACQAPLSMGFSRQEYWSRLPCPPPGDLPNPGIKPRSPALQADSLPAELPKKPHICVYIHISESLCCTPETNNFVNQPYFNEKKKNSRNKIRRENYLHLQMKKTAPSTQRNIYLAELG